MSQNINNLRIFQRLRALIAENVPKELQSRPGDEDMTVMADPPKLQVASAAASSSSSSWTMAVLTHLSLTLILFVVLR